MVRHGLSAALLLTCCLLLSGGAAAQALLLGATTSSKNSGLLDHILPRFSAATGIGVQTVVQGTGAILKLGETGDIDVLLIHDRVAEDRFMAAQFGESRDDVMESRFVLVGPRSDPAGVRGAPDPAAALARIAEAQALFASRGDASGTHAAELRLWQDVGLDPRDASGRWYRETGAGMGITLNIAAGLSAYVFTESATWANFGNRADLETLSAGSDPRLANPYGVLVVNPARHSHVRVNAARRFVAWLIGADGQAAIASFRVGGIQLFVPALEYSR